MKTAYIYKKILKNRKICLGNLGISLKNNYQEYIQDLYLLKQDNSNIV